MSVEIGQILDVVRRAAKCNSGMVEYAAPSVEQDAVDVAVSAGYMVVIGNGMAQITASGRDYVAK